LKINQTKIKIKKWYLENIFHQGRKKGGKKALTFKKLKPHLKNGCEIWKECDDSYICTLSSDLMWHGYKKKIIKGILFYSEKYIIQYQINVASD